MTLRAQPTSGPHLNDYLSESNSVYQVLTYQLPLELFSERRRLPHNDCSEISLYRVLALMATRVSRQPISSSTLMATPG